MGELVLVTSQWFFVAYLPIKNRKLWQGGSGALNVVAVLGMVQKETGGFGAAKSSLAMATLTSKGLLFPA